MKIINVSLKNNPYKIVIGPNILAKLATNLKSLGLGFDAVIVTHPSLRRLYGPSLIKGLAREGFTFKFFEVPEGENSKSVKIAFELLENIACYDVGRKIFLMALGGGVVGDLTGFIAATYKRGIPYVQVPTSLLAQIDSSIGGKVAIDLSVGKNLVGAFYQPKIVWSDICALSTLPKRQIQNALAEAVKYGIIYDAHLFDFIVDNYKKLLAGNRPELLWVVYRCSQIKAAVVLADEKETKGIRTILNFGHTLGHAIEAAGQYKLYQHGEAIALGMRMAAEISCQLRMLKASDAKRINEVLTDIGLPEKIRKLKKQNIFEHMQHDKKFVAGKNRFVLATSIGKVKVLENIPFEIIKMAVEKFTAHS